jgi:2-succinyl-6-hydroxy-2,4-cyclohexadiene-1-carboxylate synthase
MGARPFASGREGADGTPLAETPAQPIVLLHGFMQNGHAWDAVAPLLAAAGPVIAPTLAPADDAHATLDDLADQVHTVIVQACAQEGASSAVVAGYSMGGRVALALARRYPADIALLALESAGLGPRTEEDRVQWAQRNRAWAAYIEELPSMEAVVDWWEEIPLFASQKDLPPEARARQRRMRLSCDRHACALLMEQAGAHTMPLEDDACAMLARVSFPVHYLVGERDAKYGRVAARMGATGARVHRLPGGHNVHLEHPEAFARCLAACIARGTQASGRADSDFYAIFR